MEASVCHLSACQHGEYITLLA